MRQAPDNALSFSTLSYHVKGTPNQPWVLRPFSDIHAGAGLHAAKHWAAWCRASRQILHTQRGRVLFLGLGDYIELPSPSERDKMSVPLHLDTERALQTIFLTKVRRFAKTVSFMEGHLIGLLEGCHYAVLTVPSQDSDTVATTTQMLCSMLGGEYLGGLAFLQIRFQFGSYSRSVKIIARHKVGSGGTRLPASTLNATGRLLLDADADIYISAHTHKPGILPHSTMRLEEQSNGQCQVVAADQWIISMGGFLKGMVEGEPSYVVGMGRSGVVALRQPTIYMVPRLHGGRYWVELDCAL